MMTTVHLNYVLKCFDTPPLQEVGCFPLPMIVSQI